jgi:N-acetylglucosamine kinase-like BadF-type ATPase
MLIIVESGSTKADWVAVDSNFAPHFFKTEGINPAIQKEFPDLSIEPLLCDMLRSCDELFFYGAGSDNKDSSQKIMAWLSRLGFAGSVQVFGDTLGAARACFGDKSGILCILGTGSNSVVYDGKQIIKAIPSLGYVLSDEGGGVHLGKEILRAYFYGTMPEAEKLAFDNHYKINKSVVIDHIYRQQGGNRYIASFAGFLSLINGEWKDELIRRVFRDFVEIRILKYEEHNTLPLAFVGSIAYYYQHYLELVLAEYGLKIDYILQKPIYKLIDYHINKK